MNRTATEARLREEARQTPAGQLLTRMGIDYWDTDPLARAVAEHAAGEVQLLIAALRDILDAPGEGRVAMSEPDSFETQCRKASELLARLQQTN